MSLKNPVTPPGMDPGAVRLVAQRLNHYATPEPSCDYYTSKFIRKFFIFLISADTYMFKFGDVTWVGILFTTSDLTSSGQRQ